MGTDIHLYVEKKNKGQWVSIDKWTTLEEDENEKRLDVDYADRIYKRRNYTLFSILANVRNSDSVKYIESPRGLPKDLCKNIRDASAVHDEDNHSHSWLLVSEINNYEWDVKTTYHNEWRTPRESCADFLQIMENLCEKTAPEDIRIAFWFDN